MLTLESLNNIHDTDMYTNKRIQIIMYGAYF